MRMNLETQVLVGLALGVVAGVLFGDLLAFLKVAGEEKLHAVWLRKLYEKMGVPQRGEDTQRAIDALATIRENCDRLIGMNPDSVVEKALRVAMRVEEREYADIYPHFRDQAHAAGRPEEVAVYQKVIDSERQHYDWFRDALQEYFPAAA